MFYDFRQNNTFGRWVINKDVNVLVVIEASSVKQANERAESVGLYFDGISDGIDCSCCGDRWSKEWDGYEGDTVPSQYGKPIENLHPERVKGKDSIVVHFEDGSRQYASDGTDRKWLEADEEGA